MIDTGRLRRSLIGLVVELVAGPAYEPRTRDAIVAALARQFPIDFDEARYVLERMNWNERRAFDVCDSASRLGASPARLAYALTRPAPATPPTAAPAAHR